MNQQVQRKGAKDQRVKAFGGKDALLSLQLL